MFKINIFGKITYYDLKNLSGGSSNNSAMPPLFNFGSSKTKNDTAKNSTASAKNPTNNVDTNWVNNYKIYPAKNKAKYDKVYKYVETCAKKQQNHTANIKEITNMICQLSDNYQIDPEITATILANETGGFVFTPKVLSARENYKGVGQVDRNVVDCLYADTDYKYNKKYPTKRDEALSYDTRHWQQDKTRVEQIKNKYPTSNALWAAIQKDVSLGLEIGIIAFKMKLHSRKGNTVEALRDYCSGQYSLPANSTAKTSYSMPLPSYKPV
jgi:hypothetical protein